MEQLLVSAATWAEHYIVLGLIGRRWFGSLDIPQDTATNNKRVGCNMNIITVLQFFMGKVDKMLVYFHVGDVEGVDKSGLISRRYSVA